jgi:hypothetical protein
MTQKELIDKWRKEADQREEDVKWEMDTNENSWGKIETLRKCADDLEALTY